MRIGIDATVVALNGKGLSRHQNNIILALVQLDTDHEFFVFHRGFYDETSLKTAPRWHFIRVPFLLSLIWNQIQLPLLAFLYRLDLIYSLYADLPLLSPAPCIMHLFETPHCRPEPMPTKEVGLNRLKQEYFRCVKRYHRWIFPKSLHNAALVIASSQHVRDMLEKQFPNSSRKTAIVRSAVEGRFRPESDSRKIQYFRNLFSQGSEYILHFSSEDTRDNTATVFEVFKKVRPHFPGVKLVVVGSRAGQNGWSREIWADPFLKDSVIWKEFITEEVLVKIFQASSAYIDASPHKTFGFQPLEAMACGIPVVVSRIASLPEVVGDAGFLCAPNDSEGYAAALEQVLTQSKVREELVAKGLRQALQFNWISAATELLGYFEAVYYRSSANKDKHP